MATPKRRNRDALAAQSTILFRAAGEPGYIAEGGSERSLVAVKDHFGPKTTNRGRCERGSHRQGQVRNDWGRYMTEKHGPDRYHQTVTTVPQPRLRHRAPGGGRGQGCPPRWLTPDEAETSELH